MAATVWKGYITFGLISIPVRLFTAARNERVSFHQLHEPCHTRIKQQLYCPTCDRDVERSEIIKGYEIAKGQWVIVEEDEMKKIAPASTETMDILEFVKVQEVDPIYFDASYYVVPEEPGRRAYSLLLETMNRTGFAALAKVTMHQREYVVVIRPREQGLTLHTIFYPNEVRAVPEYARIQTVELRPQEIQLAEQLVTSLAGPFQAERYEDEYRKKLLELIEAKTDGKQIGPALHKKLAPVIDLMQALQRSLGQVEKGSQQAPEADKKPAAKAKSKRSVPKRAAG